MEGHGFSRAAKTCYFDSAPATTPSNGPIQRALVERPEQPRGSNSRRAAAKPETSPSQAIVQSALESSRSGEKPALSRQQSRGPAPAHLRQHIKDESVDLIIYLEPPFNSRQDYNVLFAEKDGTRSSSQIMAFEDTWEWNVPTHSKH